MLLFHQSLSFILSVFSFASLVVADHTFTFVNNCVYTIRPNIANVNCGYSPRCSTPGSGGVPNPAVSYTGPQPNSISGGGSQTLHINRQWNGRVFNQIGSCGTKGEGCTMTEFNLDTGSLYTPQAYDISNIQGFTQSIGIAVSDGCDSVTCTNVNCGCTSAYPPGDQSGCGNDSPVHGCSAGDKSWTITFCPSS